MLNIIILHFVNFPLYFPWNPGLKPRYGQKYWGRYLLSQWNPANIGQTGLNQSHLKRILEGALAWCGRISVPYLCVCVCVCVLYSAAWQADIRISSFPNNVQSTKTFQDSIKLCYNTENMTSITFFASGDSSGKHWSTIKSLHIWRTSRVWKENHGPGIA